MALAVLMVVAVNLRPALSAVGPLVDRIGEDTGLSRSAVGALTTLPLLAFGFMSLATPAILKRLGLKVTFGVAMLALAIGCVMRYFEPTAMLFAGTLTCGLGIAVGNVCLPVATHQNFQHRAGWVTGMYSSTLALGACLGAAAAGPIAVMTASTWRGALAFWAVPAVVAALFAAGAGHRLVNEADLAPAAAPRFHLRSIMRSGIAWSVAGYMGLQSLTFYVLLAWMPAILMDQGASMQRAGWMASTSQAAGVIGALWIPAVAGKRLDQRRGIVIIAAAEAIALTMGMFARGSASWVWVIAIGVILGGSFGLSLLLIVLRSTSDRPAAGLSAMSQSAGYLIAAIGPIVWGAMRDVTGRWMIPMGLLVVLAGIKVAVAWPAAGAPSDQID